MADYSANIDSIRRQIPRSTILLLRTAPASVSAMKGDFNNIVEVNALVRLLGYSKGVGVIDWAAHLHNMPDDDAFGDYIHPSNKYSLAYAEMIKSFSFIITGAPGCE